eukprot:CAMPEP_0172490754 /NCGR_PEP_ID=MMETSP1066-20121228/21293_1 /TAXON_ID=671091 /ORGANISM="Coscinodiscus wailesii, Strain CCMP2513" /LENGTH=245 /DNA_ID=CAMNT_0013259381 /DNA_START=157 /DNA_END=894 /DNA_ORIENTATION=+
MNIESNQYISTSHSTGTNKRKLNGSSSKILNTCHAPTSCLGEVVPFYEPLKVCLDDDSSIDDDDDECDDDFYFVDEELDAMAIVTDDGPSESPVLLASNSPMAATSLSSSTGNLTYLSHDSSTGTSVSKRSRSKRRVVLDNDVEVIPIPMRSEYSYRVKERLWSTPTELYENAARNSIEFASEGWNWRTVTEDENMLVCQISGELVHPIHLYAYMQQEKMSLDKNSQEGKIIQTPVSSQCNMSRT